MFDWFKKKEKKQTAPEPLPELVKKHTVTDGFRELQNNNVAAAKRIFDAVLQTDPANSDALYLSGVIEAREGRHAIAIGKMSQAIAADGNIPSYHLSLGGLLDQAGRPAEAIESYRRALALDTEDAEMRCGLGTALLLQNQYLEAFEHLSYAVRLSPGYALALFNLGVTCQKLGQTSVAQQHYVSALQYDSQNVQAENNLGTLLHERGEYQAAIHHFERALAIQPHFAMACLNIGVALQAYKKGNEAQAFIERAIALDPQSFSAYSSYALLLREQGQIDESLEASQAALAIQDNIAERIRMATLTPVVAMSATEIGVWRGRLVAAVGDLLVTRGTIFDPLREIGVCNFNLAYQPECNKVLQELSASMYLANCPSLQFVAPHCRGPRRIENPKIRVGFISRFLYQHSIGRTTRGVLAHLDREKFEVVALFVPPLIDDTVSQFIRSSADRFHVLPPSLDQARAVIGELELDILFYQDIGMDAYSYFLAYSRLAPVQCVSFGHPDTTGIPAMDYWVSSQNFETEDAQSHYSEKLFLLQNVGSLAYYYKPELKTARRSKEHFGLSQDRHIYLCPQALFKVHPDFDTVLGGVLRGDPDGEVVLVEAQSKAWTQRLRARLDQALPDVAHRIRFVPKLSEEDFLGLIAVSDVMLDTLYFNGMNTTLEAIAMGTPVVTLPTHMQRGRHTFGMYRRMQYEVCVADTVQHYIEIALRLGTDRNYRNEVSENILSRNAVLYEDKQVVREFERFFISAHEENRKSLALKVAVDGAAPQKVLFLVSSAIHVKHGVYDAVQRMAQTVATCQSIRKYCPNADIVLLDGGFKDLTDSERTTIGELANTIVSFASSSHLKDVHTGVDVNTLKSLAEIRMFDAYLNGILNNQTEQYASYSRVFKISGRYCLNSDFDMAVHINAMNKIVVAAPRVSQYNKEILGTTAMQFMSRLWSFDGKMLDVICQVFDAMDVRMEQDMQSHKFVDIEHLMYECLPVERVVTVARIGIQGELAPSGVLVSD